MPQKQFKDLNIIDDFLFSELMKDMEAARRILQLILDKPIEKVESCKTQEVINTAPENHGIRLDVYIKDGKNTVYNIEMQASPKHNIPKRTRYYQSLIDYTSMPSGEYNYNVLPMTYIIFICDFDVFGKAMYQYTFKNKCCERPELSMGDNTTKIILNTKGKNRNEVRPDLVRFLEYITQTTKAAADSSGDESIKYLQKKVDEIKNNDEKELRFMTLAEKLWESKQTGFEKGIEKGIYEMINVLIEFGADEQTILRKLKKSYELTDEKALHYYRTFQARH